MRSSFTLFLHGLLVLAVGGLGACQRASYSSSNSAAVAYEQRPPAPMAASQMTALVVATRSLAPVQQEVPSALRPHIHLATKLVQTSKIKHPRQLLAPSVSSASTLKAVERQARHVPPPLDQPVRHRSRIVALLLALLSITYIPLSLHNFYLGYYGRGIVSIMLVVVGISLVLAGFPGFLFSSEVLPIAYVGVAILAGWFLWQLSDLIRIITRDLKPKNGEY